MLGYLPLARQFFSHPLWEEKRAFSKAEAWLDLLQLAAFAPTRRTIKAKIIGMEEGELIASLRYLGKRWQWSNNKVSRFMDLLEAESMTRRETRQGETVIIVCNYEVYNRATSDGETLNGTQTRQSRDGSGTKDKKINNSEEEKRSTQPSKPGMSWSKEEGFQNIEKEDFEKWRILFPACDINRQLGLANEWLLSNPAKAHKKQWRRFVIGWLSRAQERGGDILSNATASQSKAPAQANVGPREGWKIEADIKRIESQITEIRRDDKNYGFITDDGVSKKVMRDLVREEVRRLKAKIEELKIELRKAA